MTDGDDSIRVFIPLTFRRRNGRPKILPPEPEPDFQARSQDPHILRPRPRVGVGAAARERRGGHAPGHSPGREGDGPVR
jgi:hypothetical protein